VITLLATSAVLLAYAWWLPVLVVVSTLPGLYLALRFIVTEHELTVRQTPQKRQCWYYDDVLTSAESAAEVRLFGLGGYYIALYQRLRAAIRDERLRLFRRNMVMELVSATCAIVVMGLTLLWFVFKAMRGLYTLGDLALLYQAYGNGQSLLGTLHSSLGAIYRNLLYLSNLFEYLDMESTLTPTGNRTAVARVVGRGIAFENVTFSYAGSTRPVLRHFKPAHRRRRDGGDRGRERSGEVDTRQAVVSFLRSAGGPDHHRRRRRPRAAARIGQGDVLRALSVAGSLSGGRDRQHIGQHGAHGERRRTDPARRQQGGRR
jgi:ATP-binding cassette subfamily B protein